MYRASEPQGAGAGTDSGATTVTSLGPDLWRIVIRAGTPSPVSPGQADVEIFYVDLVRVSDELRYRVRRLQNPSGRWTLLGEFWDLASSVRACERTAATSPPVRSTQGSGSLWSDRPFGAKEQALLDFEERNPVATPGKEASITAELGLTPEAYRRRLAALTRSRAAAQYAPHVVRRLLVAADHGRYSSRRRR